MILIFSAFFLSFAVIVLVAFLIEMRLGSER